MYIPAMCPDYSMVLGSCSPNSQINQELLGVATYLCPTPNSIVLATRKINEVENLLGLPVCRTQPNL